MEILITDIEKQEAVSSPGLKRFPDIVQMLSPDPLGGLSPVGALVPASVTPAKLTAAQAAATFVGMQAYKDVIALKYNYLAAGPVPAHAEHEIISLADNLSNGSTKTISETGRFITGPGPTYTYLDNFKGGFYDGGGPSGMTLLADYTGHTENNDVSPYVISHAVLGFVGDPAADFNTGDWVSIYFYYQSESNGWIPIINQSIVQQIAVGGKARIQVTPGYCDAHPDLPILTEILYQPAGSVYHVVGYIGPCNTANPGVATEFTQDIPISTFHRAFDTGVPPFLVTRDHLVYFQGCWLSVSSVSPRTVEWYGDIGIDELGEFTVRFAHSKKITAMVSIENSLLIFGESEAKILSGSLVEGTISIQDYPVPIGADDLGLSATSKVLSKWLSPYPVTGLYAAVIWRGKIWQVGIGQAREVSQVIQKPGYRFTCIHYDATRNTIFARRTDGIWFGYSVDRDWWYQLSLNGIDYTYGWGGMFFNKNGATIRYATLAEDAVGGTTPVCKLGFTKWSPHPDVRSNWQPLELSFELYYADDYAPSLLELPKPELHYWTYSSNGSVGVPVTVFGVQKGNRWVFPIQPKTIQYMTWWIEIRPSTSTPAEIRQIRIVGPIKFQVRSMATSERQGQK